MTEHEQTLPFRLQLTPGGVEIKTLIQSFSPETLKAMCRGNLIPEDLYRKECERRVERNRVVAVELNERLARQQEKSA